MMGAVTRFKVKAGKAEEFEAFYADLTAKVKANEPGNLFYELTRSRSDTAEYFALEFYRDQAAFDAHATSPHFQAAFPKLMEMWDGMPETTFVDQVG